MNTSTSTTPTADDAINFLGTVIEVAPDRNAYYADETGRYYIVTDADLTLLARYLDRTDLGGDAYSHWCAATGAVEMPAWWTPDRQSAYRMRAYPCCGQTPHYISISCPYYVEHGEHEPVVDELLSPDESEEFDAAGQADDVDVYLVTADLSTGEEVR